MDNDRKLFDGLLKADGIEPSSVTDSERAVFREMLEKETKRVKRLSWCSVGGLWIFVLVMLALCVSENILEALHIPFVAAFGVLVVAAWIVIIRYLPRHNKMIRESNKQISKLHYLVYGKHRGIVMVSRKNGRRIIHWPSLLILTVVLWSLFSLGGAGVYYLLCQHWIYTTMPVFYIFLCTVMTLSFVGSGLYAGLKAPLEELVEVKSKHSKLGAGDPGIWRIIMNSRKTQFAVVAVIVIAVLFGVDYFGASIDGSNVAWAEVMELLNNNERYKCRMRVVREKGPAVPDMNVYYMNLSLRRQEMVDGTIQIIDMRGTDAITVELYPDEKRAVVTKLLGFGPKKDPHIIEMVKRFGKEPDEILGTKEVDGRTLYGFRHRPNEHNDFTVWVDPETKLPVEIELVHTNRGQTIYLDEFEFDFELDESAFSTEVPQGYEVKTLINDYRPVEPEAISVEDIGNELGHKAYAVGDLNWAEKVTVIKTVDPLGTKTIVYLIGLRCDDGNRIVIAQGEYYDGKRMVWIPNQEMVLESSGGVKLYTHPNGAIYAKYFLEAFGKAVEGFIDVDQISDDRFTRMIVMSDGTILSMSANDQMSDERLLEFVESLVVVN